MEERDLLAEARGKAADRLRREGDFRHQDDGVATLLQRLGDGLHVDLGLTAAGDAEEEHGALLAQDDVQRLGLGGRQRQRLAGQDASAGQGTPRGLAQFAREVTHLGQAADGGGGGGELLAETRQEAAVHAHDVFVELLLTFGEGRQVRGRRQDGRHHITFPRLTAALANGRRQGAPQSQGEADVVILRHPAEERDGAFGEVRKRILNALDGLDLGRGRLAEEVALRVGLGLGHVGALFREGDDVAAVVDPPPRHRDALPHAHFHPRRHGIGEELARDLLYRDLCIHRLLHACHCSKFWLIS